MAQPAQPEPNLLSPFGDQAQGANNWFRLAFRYDRATVLKWMEDVASQRNPNCPPPHLRADDHFMLLLQTYSQVESLAALNGVNFVTPTPKCHIYRSQDPLYGKKKGQDQNRPQFVVRTWTNNYTGGPDARNIQMDYWGIYDLIGLFFGLLGGAPLAADKNNFFLPLTAVYARWCTRLAGKLERNKVPDSGVGDVPAMFQCTWSEREDGKGKWFFLGSSNAGDAFAKSNIGHEWKMRVRKKRFDMLLKEQQLTMVLPHDFSNTEPEILQAGGSEATWGNCAESFPFAHCMTFGRNRNLKVQGLALSKKFLNLKEDVTEYSGYYDDNIWDSVVGPCFNCRRLIAKAQADVFYFRGDFDACRATYRVLPAPPEEPEVGAAEVAVAGDMKEPPARKMVEVVSN
ncbi:hypothetical protein V8C42DRAFT_308430 [Trichoderma barbatum]